jgi:hypothetical protein
MDTLRSAVMWFGPSFLFVLIRTKAVITGQGMAMVLIPEKSRSITAFEDW